MPREVATSATAVLPVGLGGTILHYDGARWTAMDSPLTGKWDVIRDVWDTSSHRRLRSGSRPSGVGRMGAGRAHYDGMTRSHMSMPPDEVAIKAIRGSAGNNVFAGGGSVIPHTKAVR